MPDKMNVLVISSDSFRRDNLTVHGGTGIHTPNLDALARQSAVFEQAYAGSYPTIPNRTDIFLGTWTFPNYDWAPLDRDVPTLAEVLADAGVATHLEIDCPHMVQLGSFFERGFHSWNWVRGQENDPLPPWPLAESMKPPGVMEKYRLPITAMKRHMASRIVRKRLRDEDYSMAVVARNTVEMLRHLRSAKQFFLWVDMFDPHEPFDPPRHYFDLYYPGYKGVVYEIPVYGPCDCYTPSELKAIRSAYLGEATMVDHWIGFVLGSLEELGLEENTTVVFTSDHGLAYGDHGQTGKNISPMFANIARIPLLVSTPQMRAKGRSKRATQLVQPVDLMPTILDVMGVKRPKGWQGDGVSLAPLLKGRSGRTRDIAVTGSYPSNAHPLRPGGHLRISTRKWALIYPPEIQGERKPPMLFDLAADPGETRNVIAKRRRVAQGLYMKYVAFHRHYSRQGGDVPLPAPGTFFD